MASAIGISVRDTVLWVEDTGETHLPAVVCLHSLWLDGTMFGDLVKAAAGKFRVIRPDFRGQGQSAPPTTEIIDMETCALDIEALIEKLGLTSVNLVVQSMGGDVAIRMAARRPEAYRSLIMLASSARGGEIDELDFVRQWLQNSYQTGFVGDSLQLLREVMFGVTTRKTVSKQVMLKHWSNMLEASPRSLWPAIRGVIERESAVDLLPRITTPSLVFSGEEDVARPPAWADEVVENLPNARLVRLKAIGHSPILEAPELVIPQIVAFLENPAFDESRFGKGLCNACRV
ncbi:alpha/beta fold hydrolase [Rhizobium sp. BR 362]|uniref:alpha/beta fold hydrolase n=1 Tax=Rhizobium sp. BR 362 TaxID=3040670 RepID=UPI002F425DD9